MSRSHWALTKGCTRVGAMLRGAGKQAGLEASTVLVRLLGAVLSITRLLSVVMASAATLAFVPPPATARVERSLVAQLPTTQPSQHSHTTAAKGPVAPARHRRRQNSGSRAARPVHTSAQVLALGSGFGQPGGSPMVRSLQRKLAAAGFGPGPIDGLYGPRTESAVARFQSATGLRIDGVAGPHTLAAVYSRTPTVHPGAGYGSGGSPIVRELQHLLARAGYDPHGIDGLYGPRTGQAVRRFQARHGLPVDGIARTQTFIALLRQGQTKHRSNPATRYRATGSATHGRTPNPTTTSPTIVHPRTAPRNPAQASVPRAAGRTRQPSGGPSIGWLVLIAGALGIALLLTATSYTRRRRTKAGFAPPLPGDGGGAEAPAHVSDAAVAVVKNGDRSEALVRPSEARGDADAAFRLGVLLEEQNDLARAEAAYRRADQQGHAGAASNLGVLLERRGDLEGAEAAYRRAGDRGDLNGAFNLAVLLEERHDATGAEAAYRHADDRGHAAAASNLGVLLERRGNREGAQAAYRRADERGDANGAFNLGVLLEEQNDLAAAAAAYRRADRRGHAEVANAARAALRSLRASPDGGHVRNGGDLDVE